MISLALMALILVVTGFLLLRNHELPRIFALLHQVDIPYMLMGLLIMIMFFSFEAVSVRYLLSGLGYKLRWRRCLTYAMVDFYFSSITPASCGGQPSQLYYMGRDGLPLGASSLVLLLFNTAYHISVLFVAGLACLLSQGSEWQALGAIKYLLLYGAVAQLLVAAFYCLAIFSNTLAPKLLRLVTKGLAKLRLLRRPEQTRAKLEAQIAEYQRGADYVRGNPRMLFTLLLLTTCHVLALYSLPFWVYKAFGLTGCGFWSIVAMQASLTLAMESLPIPGGVGVTEGSFMLLYAGIFGNALVLPALILTRGLNYYCCLAAGGLISALAQHRRVRPLATPKLSRYAKGAVL